jgi:predicted ribonuclease toxin of YeeF-YezG toxin-antitoxin module
MKRKIAAGSIAVALVALSLVVAAAAAAKADFSGKWVMDKAKSEGVPPTMEQTMTVTQTGDKIELETKVVAPQGERVIKDSYTADGKEIEFTPQGPQGAMGKGKRTAKWSADGAALEVSETATLDGPNGPDEVSATRKWSLSADGKTLTIEMAFSGEQGVQKTKRVFVKQ